MTERGKTDTLWLSKREEASSGHFGEDVRVVHVDRKRSNVKTANGLLPRGLRVVAHNFADVSFLFPVMVRRRTFFPVLKLVFQL